jgi:HK97 family phage major capsid protein
MSDLSEIKKTVDEFMSTWTDYKADNEKRLKAIEDRGGEEPADHKERFAKMDTALDSFEVKVTELGETMKKDKERIEVLETAARRPRTGGGSEKTPEQIEHEEKVDLFLRKGETDGLAELEEKVLRTSVNTDGGYALTQEREASILGRVTEMSPVRQIGAVRSIGAASWAQMRSLGSVSGGGWVSEQATRAVGTTPTFGMLEVTPGEQYEMPSVTQTALDDLAFNIEQFLEDETALAMAIRENTAFVVGDGVGKPRGFMAYTAGTDDTLMQIEQVNSGHASQVKADGAINCQEALFEVFQPNASWVMRRTTRREFRKLKDGDGTYLLRTDPSGNAQTPGLLTTILDKPVTLLADVAAIGANALAYAYGDFRQAYLIVDRIGIRVLRDPFTSKPNILFYTTKRTGGGVIKPQAIKIGKIAA